MPTRVLAQRCGAYLALVALTLQLALSFAHLHRHVSATFDDTDVASIGPARPTLQALDQLPSRLADDDDHCQICFSSFLLSNSSLPAAPENPRALKFVQVDRAFNPVSDRVFQPRRVGFLSRAPPAA